VAGTITAAQLKAGLAGIAAGLQDLEDAADDAAATVVARARRLAPVATGRLAQSIRGDHTGSTATAGTSVRYGLPVHFGVPSRSQRPRPFLFQAVDAETKSIVAAYTKDVDRLIGEKV
jgi:phage gpG-like protein